MNPGQELVRYWFSDSDGFPFRGSLKSLPRLKEMLPGTAVWHFGYSRGGWIKAIAGPEQSNPGADWPTFSSPIPSPFTSGASWRETDSPKGQRLLKGAFFRLLESEAVEYSSGERSEAVLSDGTKFGEFHVSSSF